jgi:hypothetical protein
MLNSLDRSPNHSPSYSLDLVIAHSPRPPFRSP